MWQRKGDAERQVSQAGPFDPKESAVLIVEDNPDDVILEVRALESFGIRHIYHAETAEEAIGFVEREHCDAALIDYQLPGMDGLRFVERLRELSPDTRMIVVTGIRDEHVAVQAMKLGISDYVPKDELLTSGIVRSLQAALKQVSAGRAERRASAVEGGAGSLAAAREEIDWLLDSLGEASLRDVRTLRLAAYEERGRTDYPDILAKMSPLRQLHLEEQGLDVVMQTFARYLRESFRRFPEPADDECSSLARMLVERGSSPWQVLALYRTSLGFLGLERIEPPFNPALCLIRLLSEVLEEHQARQSLRSRAV